MAIGTTIVPSDFKAPVLLANGEVITPPWYVTVEGNNVAIVDSKEKAKEVVKEVANIYKTEKTVDVTIEEKTSPKEMSIENRDPKPDIMTVSEAVDKITKKENVTVLTKEIVTEEKTVDFGRTEKRTKELSVGEMKIQKKGTKGSKKVTKEITKENGEVIKTDVKSEVLTKAAKPQVVLVGTRVENGGENVSLDESAAGTGELGRPLTALNITSKFGPRWGRFHQGVDLAMSTGTPIYAADNGTVIYAKNNGSYGKLVKIDHGNGMLTYYAHCNAFVADVGDSVKKGETIAKVGSTGNSTGPHLHFEVLVDGENKNPLNYL
jgi:murein DD-endopeptidase MepM/ murein hydrolase activator NlpD